jgi:hypothetical protein
MAAAAKTLKEAEGGQALSEEMVAFADHLAELLAEEFVRAMKEESDEGSGLCEVLERESAGAEHRRSDPGVPGVREA